MTTHRMTSRPSTSHRLGGLFPVTTLALLLGVALPTPALAKIKFIKKHPLSSVNQSMAKRAKATGTPPASHKSANPKTSNLNASVAADGLASSQDELQHCSQIFDNALRLACYDKLSHGLSVYDDKKVPLDLRKTVVSSFEARRAVPVLLNAQQNDERDTSPSAEGNVTPSADQQVAAVAVTGVAAASEGQPAQAVTVVAKDADTAKGLLQEAGLTPAATEAYSPLSVLYDLDRNDPRGLFTLRPHQPMYALPLWYSSSPNRHPHSPSHETPEDFTRYQNLDTKVQISFKTKMMEDLFKTNADLWFGYTQKFYWQIYNSKDSRPFKSSDYEPEIFLTQPVSQALPLGGRLRMLGVGAVHHSNGEADPLSRSWNRVYVNGGMEWGKLTVIPRVWAILPDFDKSHADNTDIGDYMGYGDVRWQYALSNQRSLGGLVRYNPFENKGAIQLDYAQPIRGGAKAYVQFFHGYGERILDYNHKDTNVGIGVMFNDFPGI